MEGCKAIMRKPIFDEERYDRVWKKHVAPLSGAYEMNP